VRLRLKRLAYRVASPLLQAWWTLARADHDGAKCVITNAGAVLLVRHTYGDRRRWDFPGGFVRRGEEPLEAARREMAEELGLALGAGDLRPLGALRLHRGRRGGTVHYYRLELADRALDPDPGELGEVAWFAPGALPRRLGDHVPRALAWIAPATAGSETPCV
jgi:8-oxo-dGTP pyrophosphatase MutT (NUDIX family)